MTRNKEEVPLLLAEMNFLKITISMVWHGNARRKPPDSSSREPKSRLSIAPIRLPIRTRCAECFPTGCQHNIVRDVTSIKARKGLNHT